MYIYIYIYVDTEAGLTCLSVDLRPRGLATRSKCAQVLGIEDHRAHMGWSSSWRLWPNLSFLVRSEAPKGSSNSS